MKLDFSYGVSPEFNRDFLFKNAGKEIIAEKLNEHYYMSQGGHLINAINVVKVEEL